MSESAMSLRERKLAETSKRLRDAARRFALERGLTGFTVEELCEEVGISRRTFFNYFASKEDAVLGFSARRDTSHLDERFLAGGNPASEGLSTTLLDELVELAIARWKADTPNPDAAQIRETIAVVEREPRLFTRVMEAMTRDEARDVALVERREGLPAGDLRAASAVQILAAIARASAFEFFEGDTGEPIEAIAARRLTAMRAVFAADLSSPRP